MTTTPTSGAADRAIESCPELNMGNYDEVDVERLNDWAIRANDEIDRLHALAAGQATAAPAQPVAQQGVAYAALPTSSHAGRVYEEGFLIGTCPLYTADKMRAFADATHTLRASHGQAPAQPATLYCKGRNCDAVDGEGHSDECASDHERAASGLDTAGNRNPVARYDGYRGAPCNPAHTKDQQAAWLEGYEARNRQGITPSPQAAQQAVEGGDAEDAARYRWPRDLNDWYAEPRIDDADGAKWQLTFYSPKRIEDAMDDDSLDAAVDAARKQGEKQ